MVSVTTKNYSTSIYQTVREIYSVLPNGTDHRIVFQKNIDAEKIHGEPAPSSAIQLPFLIVSTDKKTVIDCSISNDKTEYLFVFDNKFEIHDDIEILKRMGLSMGKFGIRIRKRSLTVTYPMTRLRTCFYLTTSLIFCDKATGICRF